MSYLNATAGTSSGMLNSRVPAKMLGVPIIIHDYITGGFTSNNEGVRPNLRTDHMASNPWTDLAEQRYAHGLVRRYLTSRDT